MSHLLIVQGSERESVKDLFAEGLSLFGEVCGLRSTDRVVSAKLALSVLPRTSAPSSHILRAPTSTRWLCGAGTWFYQGIAAEAGLRRLLEDREFTTNNPAAALGDLDGHFVLASGDLNSGEFIVVTDRLGILHIYSVRIGNTQVLSTSLIVLAVLADAEWDPEGCRQFLASGNIFEPARTLFKGINKLEDAQIYGFADGCLTSQRRYWSVESVLHKNADAAVGAPQVSEALQESLRIVHRNFPRPLLDFTSGFDTRGLVGAMLKANLNLDLVVNGSDEGPDAIASTRIAQQLGLRHHHRFRGFTIPQQWWDRAKESLVYCDGECDLLQYGGTLEGHLRNAEGFDATVNGAIGEVLKGHWWELLFPYTGRRNHFDSHMVARRRFTFEGEVPGLLAFHYETGLTDYYAEVIRQTVSGMEAFPNTALVDTVYLVIRQQKWLGRTVSATDRIWPCISPYGFRRPLELALSAPVSAKLHHRMSRRLIEYESPQLARFPLPGGYPAQPLRLATVHRFRPVLLHYGRMVIRRLLIEAKLTSSKRSMKLLYPTGALPLSQLATLEEVRTLVDPKQMCTRELYDDDVLRNEMNNCLNDTSTNAYRMGRVLTLELLSRKVRAAARGLSLMEGSRAS
jgi:hypothetical protein